MAEKSNAESSKETTLIKPLIEEHLPSQFLYDLGLYLQTCAHIELHICTLICRMEGLSNTGLAGENRFHELRKLPQKDLIKQLRKSLHSLPEPYRSDITQLTNWIDSYKLNRHIAAHGAFTRSNIEGSVSVLYTHVRKDGELKEFIPETAQLTRERVLELIYDADRILRIVWSVRKFLDDRLLPT